MKIQEVMTRAVKTLTPRDTVQHAAEQMALLDIGAVPVERDGKPIGIVSDRDIVLRAVAKGYDSGKTTVSDVMTTELQTVRPEDSIEKVADLMKARQIRRVLVVNDDGQLAGIASLGDLVTEEEAKQLSGEVLADVSAPQRPMA